MVLLIGCFHFGPVGEDVAIGTASATGGDLPSLELETRADSLLVVSDLDEVLEELQEAGIVPSSEELRLILGRPRLQEDAGEVLEERKRGSGAATVRVVPTSDDGWDPRTSLRYSTDHIVLRARARKRSDEWRDYRGSLAMQWPAWQFRVGDLGYSWGYGLLSAAPGRGPSLAAGSSLAAPRAGSKAGGSSFDDLAVTGVSMAGEAAGWSVNVLAGTPQNGESVAPLDRSLLSIRKGFRSCGVGAMASRYGSEDGVSMVGDWRGTLLAGGFEAAHWYSKETTAGGGAWSARMAVKEAGLFSAEGIVAGGSGGRVAYGGRRSAVMPTPDGNGWAVRTAIKPSAGQTLRMLMARGVGYEVDGTPCRRTVALTDLEGRMRATRPLSFSIRWRRRTETRAGWSERFPWESLTAEPETRRMVFSLTGTHEEARRIFRILHRSQVDSGPGGHRTRKLLQLSGKWRNRGRWGWQAAWATAWGGDADLVSAISPLGGFVLPRHWGSWRSETVAGVEYALGCFRWQTAVSRRIPVSELEKVETWTIWAKADLRW